MKQDKLYEIISSFYDFKINRIEIIKTELEIEISLPWSNVIGLESDYLLIKLLDCNEFKCEYYKVLSDQLIEAYPGKFIKDSHEVLAYNIDEIINDIIKIGCSEIVKMLNKIQNELEGTHQFINELKMIS